LDLCAFSVQVPAKGSWAPAGVAAETGIAAEINAARITKRRRFFIGYSWKIWGPLGKRPELTTNDGF
jgi:hypothetical protein